jgi:4-aminobutyrate aminotransferase/(S)-3-amino-2-methylpropionate transaminase
MEGNKELFARRRSAVPGAVFNVSRTFAAMARNATVIDVEGNEYIDFAGGIGVMNVGHSHPKVVKAVQDQASQLMHSCFHIVQYEQYVRLAERLMSLTPGSFDKMCAFFNSGAEAVENAVKVARYATGRQGVIAFENGFHGRTLLAMSLTGKVKPYKFGFGPFAPEIYRMPYPYPYRDADAGDPDYGLKRAESLRDFFIGNVAPENTACLIVEPITGEGGFIVPPEEYFGRLKEICEEFGVVFIADEVQSGIGRTGKMFAMQHFGVEADITVTAKSLAAGMPLSAIVGRKELLEAPHVGGLGGTYGGNPVCCAAANAVLDIFEEENLLETSESLGRRLRQLFESWTEKFEIIGEVRGLGPMLALELVRDRRSKEPAAAEAKELTSICHENGLILLACGNFGNVIRTLMPLTISDDELERGLSILEKGLEQVDAKVKK